MTKKADKELLNAVLEPRKQGTFETIADACSAGADPNAVCPECTPQQDQYAQEACC